MARNVTFTQDSRVAVTVAEPPSNVPVMKVIPGLTLHLPIDQEELQECLHGPLFTLFQSCMKSKLKLKLRSLFDDQSSQWVVSLLIEDELISKGISESHANLKFQSYDSPLHCKCLSGAKVLAANKALDILKNCPQRQNTVHESFVRSGETVPGLKLYLDDPCPQREEDCLALLTESCRKCNLLLTWWDDEGCEVFKSSCITVLLINSKPICYAWGDTLEDSKKETATKAILWLKTHHTIVSKGTINELNSSAHILTKVPGLTLYLPCKKRDRDASISIQRSVSQSQLSLKLNDIGIVNRNGTEVYATNLIIGDTVVACGYGKEAELSRKNIVWEDVLESLLCTQPVVYDPDEGIQSMFDTTKTVICGPDGKPKSSFDDSQSVVPDTDKESLSLVDTQPVVHDVDKISESTLGLDKETNFETTNNIVPGLTMYVRELRSHSVCSMYVKDKAACSTIDRSVNHCKLTLKLKNKGRVTRNNKLVYRAALFIGSTIVAWCYGGTYKSARKNISWQGALESLLKTQPVVCMESEPLSEFSKDAQSVLCDPDVGTQPVIDSQPVMCDSERKPGSSLDDTQPVTPGTDKESISLVNTQPVVFGLDKKPGSFLGLDKETNFETTNSVVPGLTMYIRYKGCRRHIPPHSTIDRSISHCKLTKKLENMGRVMRNNKLVFRTALFIGSTIVAWCYGSTYKSARKNISWQGALESLLKTQPVVCMESESLSKLSKNTMKKERKLLASQDVDNIHEDNVGDDLYIVISEWVNKEKGGVESMFDSDAVIRKYMKYML